MTQPPAPPVADEAGGYNVDPVKRHVLSNADGKLLLLSDQSLAAVRYNESQRGVMWETCTLRKWLNGCDGQSYTTFLFHE